MHLGHYTKILPRHSKISTRESLPRYSEEPSGICDYAKLVFAVGFLVLILNYASS